MMTHAARLAALALLGLATGAAAQTPTTASTPDADDARARSPWLFVPLLTNGPKLGTSYGAMIGYILRLDAESSPSLVALKATTSNTSSTVVAAVGNFFFHANRDRLVASLAGGKVSNDYLDFLGTGQQVQSDETLRSAFVRYEHAVHGPLYLGAQWVYADYDIEGGDENSEQLLDVAGLAGTVSSGPGLVLAYDTRDDKNYPTAGVFGQLYNLAFREAFGSDDNYDTLVSDLRWYRSTSSRTVFAMHGKLHFSHDAPASRQSTIQMRGYTSGQYLGRNSMTFELEGRHLFRPRWGFKMFGGVSCLFGDGKSCDGEDVFPMIGVGGFFVLKPREHMVLNVEYAKGEGDNQGFYLRFGNRF